MSKTGLAAGSVVLGVAVLGLKAGAYWTTGSVAFFSDALETVVNVTASFAALAAIHFGERPADANHPFGHHKAEYFSAVLEGALIVVAALVIFREVYLAFLTPVALPSIGVGFVLNGAATVLNAVWAAVLIRHGRRHHSPALAADGQHLLGDVVSSLAVIVGLAFATLTGWRVLDPIMGGAVAVYILYSGWTVLKGSIGGLMDEAAPSEMVNGFRKIIAANATGAIEAHDLRTRRAGGATFLEFHLVVPGSMPVTRAHEICDGIETALKQAYPTVWISIHVEPEDKAKHSGIVVL